MPKVDRAKLEPKSRKCVLLGYGANQKGYRLYDLERMKVIHNRDVAFDESCLPGIQKESGIKYLELPVDDESVCQDVISEETCEQSPLTVDEEIMNMKGHVNSLLRLLMKEMTNL